MENLQKIFFPLFCTNSREKTTKIIKISERKSYFHVLSIKNLEKTPLCMISLSIFIPKICATSLFPSLSFPLHYG